MNEAGAAIVALTIGLAGVSAAAISFGIAWHRAARRAQRLEDRLLWGTRPEPAPTARELVSAQLDQLAGQVDRLTEGQEFLARILADRGVLSPASPPPEPRTPTPH